MARNGLTLAVLLMLSLAIFIPMASADSRVTPPTVTSDIVSPAYYALGATIPLTGTASDDLGIADLQLSTNGGMSWTVIYAYFDNSTGKYSYSWNTEMETAGNHQVSIKAKDVENKFGSVSLSIVLDGNSPVVSIKTPATNGDTVTVSLGDTIVISGDASDVTTAIVALNISVDDGNSWIDIKDSLKGKAWTYSWVTKPTDQPKRHEVFVQATDRVGHVTQESVNLTLSDIKPPQVAITSPDDEKEFTAWTSITVKGTATDNIAVADLQISTVAKGTAPKKSNITGKLNGGVWTYVWDSKALLAGKYTVQVWAKDKKGNLVTDAINITLTDKTLPQITITLPTTGSSFNHGESVSLMGKASDNIKLAKVELLVDALPAVNITKDVSTGGSYTHIVADLKDGPHTLKVKATDMSGNTNETQVVVKIKAAQAAVPVAALAGIAVVIVVLVIVLFIAMKKGWIGPKKQPVPGTESMAQIPPPTPAPTQPGPPVQAAPVAPGPYPPPPAYQAQTYQQPAYQAPEPQPYVPPAPEPVTSPKLELEPPTVAPLPIEVDEEEEYKPPTQPLFQREEPKPEKPPEKVTPPIPGPPKKPGFQVPALAKNPQQAPAQCPACGLDVDYETLICQECGARLF